MYTVGTVLVDLWRLVHQWFWLFLTIGTVYTNRQKQSKTVKRQSKQQKWPLVYQSSHVYTESAEYTKPSSAGRLFQGFSTLSVKKHVRTSTRQLLGRSLYAWPALLRFLSPKVTFIRISEPNKNLVSQDQVMSQSHSQDFPILTWLVHLHNSVCCSPAQKMLCEFRAGPVKKLRHIISTVWNTKFARFSVLAWCYLLDVSERKSVLTIASIHRFIKVQNTVLSTRKLNSARGHKMSPQ